MVSTWPHFQASRVPYHYISICSEAFQTRTRFHVPRNQWKVGGRREETWKIQSASRSKRYANERVPPEAGRTTSVTIATTTTSSVFLSLPVNTVRSGCFFLRCSSGNLFTRVSALSPNNIFLLYFNSPFAFFPTPTRRVSLVFILGIF